MPSELILPPGVELGEVRNDDLVGPVGPGRVVVDNRTDLPDDAILGAARDYFVENASLAWGHQGTFQTYANGGNGSMLARAKFTPPANVHEEIKLARDLVDHDSDVKATVFAMLATAFGEGMENFHEDERTTQLFNKTARQMGLDAAFKEIYREYLIASQVTTVAIFTRGRVSFSPRGTSETIEERLALPMIATLHAEHIRVVGSDLFGSGDLAYLPPDETLRKWLEEFFGERTTAARRAAMQREDPLVATLFTDRVKLDDERRSFITGTGEWAYKLNPRMASRFTMPKGNAKYPCPLLTANLALVEAKRLLNVMDYALLQGGANFIVVAKKGSDQRPASDPELTNLGQVVAKAGRTGVIVGDHRLNFEIITPNLSELLNADKRSLVGRKIADGLLRVPELPDNADAEGVRMWTELLSRVIGSDRRDIKRHVEATVYEETANRNRRIFADGPPKLWFPKIILQGTQYFTDYVLKLRDRGDIPRKFAVEAGGFDWEAGVAQRQRELVDNIDVVMAPSAVPFSSPNAGPQDNNNGRPVGSGPNNGAPGALPGPGRDSFAPRQQITRNAGETIRAYWDDELASTVRVGEVTHRLLEQYPDRSEGRITAFERRALESGEQASEGPVTVVPVNPTHWTRDERMIRLAPGFGVILGYRTSDEAIVAKAFSFRQPEFDELAAQELLMRLGYGLPEEPEEEEAEYVEETEILRDEHGNPTGSRKRRVRVDS